MHDTHNIADKQAQGWRVPGLRMVSSFAAAPQGDALRGGLLLGLRLLLRLLLLLLLAGDLAPIRQTLGFATAPAR